MNKPVLLFAAIVIGSLAVSLDFASVDLALPALEKEYALSFEGVQWVLNSYMLAFAVLMVTGGKLADAYGRRRIFQIGMALFGLASLLGGMAWSSGAVIAFRALQGVGAALMWPAMIGLACVAVGEKNRGFALGLVLGTCSIGNSAGPVVGGALTQWWSWRWVLWINVPMAALTMVITALAVPPDPKRGEAPKNDYTGMAMLTGGLVALMVTVYQVDAWGWTSGKTLGLLAVAGVLLGTLPWVERRTKDALMPMELMGSPEFITLCLAAMGICQMFLIVLLYFTQYAMKFQGDNPMWAGARVVPFMLSYGLVSFFGGQLYAKFGARKLLSWGLAAAAAATVLLGIVGPGAQLGVLYSLLLLLGLGVGAVIPTMSTRAVETAGLARASLAGGLVFMCQLSGAALLLAVMTALFAASSQAELGRQLAAHGLTPTPTQAEAMHNILLGSKTEHTLTKLGEAVNSPLIEAVNVAYNHGLGVALWAGAAVVAVTFFLALRYVPARGATEGKAS